MSKKMEMINKIKSFVNTYSYFLNLNPHDFSDIIIVKDIKQTEINIGNFIKEINLNYYLEINKYISDEDRLTLLKKYGNTKLIDIYRRIMYTIDRYFIVLEDKFQRILKKNGIDKELIIISDYDTHFSNPLNINDKNDNNYYLIY